MRPVSAAAFLFDAKGVCFLATATRLFGANDILRLYSWDAWRPGEIISDLLVATWACVQAASEAAPRITASHCTTLRSPEPELKGAPMQIALMSTYEVLAQLLENISSPAYRIRHARVAIQSERNNRTRAIAASFTRFHVSVVIEPHRAVEGINSDGHTFRRSDQAARDRPLTTLTTGFRSRG